MKFVKNMNLDYVEPAGGKNLYDGVDLSVEDCVEARYWKQNGHLGNPDISLNCSNRTISPFPDMTRQR